MEVLQKIDLYGTPITFRVFENEKYHSIISVSLTLITLISTILFSYFFGLDFIFHLESQIIQSTRTNKTYEFYNLSMDDFFFAWQIEDPDSQEINITDILYQTVGYYSYKTGEIESIKYSKCKNYNISFSIPNDIKNYYCIDMKNYSQGGGWENENKIEFLYIYINMCNGNKCSKKSDLVNLLDSYGRMYLVIYYPTISFVPDEEIPYEISYTKKNIILDKKLLNINRYYIQKYIFEDDEGWVVPKIKSKKIFGISDIETSIFLNDMSDDDNDEILVNSYLYTGNFYIDRKYSYYKRSFTKTFESLAIDYAFFKTIFIICNFISSFCNKFLLFENIMVDGSFLRLKTNNNTNNSELHHVFNDYGERIESSYVQLRMLNNNKTFFNNINKENKNIINIENKNKKNESENKENHVKFDNSVIIKKNHKKVVSNNNQKSIYKLLFFHIFRCMLPKKAKIEYKVNLMNRKSVQKKLDIRNYLNLIKQVDELCIQIQKCKIKNKNMMADFVN